MIDEVCDRSEQVFNRVESLLDAGETAEALRLLLGNEAELRRLGPAPEPADRSRETASGLPPSARDGAVVVPAVEDYARGNARTSRLLVLTYQAGRLLRRCEAMRDRTAEELRQLQTRRSFGAGPSVAGTWFSTEA